MGTRFGFVSTFPPTRCGLATFTAALLEALTQSGQDEGRVARLVESPEKRPTAAVVAQIVQGDSASTRHAAARLNDCDVVIVQHEFGVYGGEDGAEILELMPALTVPSVVVLHTVLAEPTASQRAIIEAVTARADAVVTMTIAARNRLADKYQVDPGKVSVIAHGAPDMTRSPMLSPAFSGRPAVVLTWGLLGPGKGLEWGIDAMAMLADLTPAPQYVIAGQTHPKVLAREGDQYLTAMRERIGRLGLAGFISLDGRYRDTRVLAALVASADVVLLPNDSTDQATSGVLVEAVAAGKPVVATAFPHALELLAGGAGLLVPHRDASAIAAALRTVLTQRDVANTMAAAARASAPELHWSAVADRYRALADQLIATRVAV